MAWLRMSSRVADLEPSATVAVATRAKRLKAEGRDIIGFGAGEPDFDTPEVIKRAAIDALHAGRTKYEAAAGPKPAREAIARKLCEDNDLPIDADGVIITSGAKAAFFQACFALLGDPAPDGGTWEVIVPAPAWVSYAPIARMCGGTIVEVPLLAADGFALSPAALREAITPRSRLLVINSPSNPCGTVMDRQRMQKIAEVVADAARAIAPHLVVITDEIYEKLIFDGMEHASFGALPGVADRTVTLNALSKSYAMTGWRVGYAAATGELAETLIPGMARVQGQSVTNITSFLYPAIEAAFSEASGEIERIRATFEGRRDLVIDLLGGIDGIETARPSGAMYAFPKVASFYGGTSAGGATIHDSLGFCEALLEEQGVAMVPGGAFGGCGDEHVRISYACSDDDIREGLRRLAVFVGGLK